MINTIKMSKRFDYSASGAFNSAIGTAMGEDAADQKIQLDCIHMDYIDSAGIGLLVMAHKKAMSKGFTIEIVHAKPSIKEILLLANLQKLISIK
jgi:anti-anti-sigma factor